MYDIVLAVQFPRSICKKDYCLKKYSSTVAEKTKWLVKVQKVSQTFFYNIISFTLIMGVLNYVLTMAALFELNTQRY